MREHNKRWIFYLKKVLLWITELINGLKLNNDGFISGKSALKPIIS